VKNKPKKARAQRTDNAIGVLIIVQIPTA